MAAGKGNGARTGKGGGGGGGSASPAALDDTMEVMSERKRRFKAWAKGYKQKKLTENRMVHWK